MLNKRKIFIFLVASISILSVVGLFIINKKYQEKIISNSEELSILKRDFPKITNARLIDYFNISKSVDLGACKIRKDVDDCVISASYIKNNSDFCHFLLINEKNEFTCLNQFLKKNSNTKLLECKPLEGDKYFNCLLEVFYFYDNKEQCTSLIDENSIATCKEMFDYHEIYGKYDRNLCQSIVDEKIRAYCLKNILPKIDNVNTASTSTEMIKEVIIDADKDGLSDSDEIAIYKTYPNNPDTDGDGYSDGEEVKNGFNPLGEGKLIQ